MNPRLPRITAAEMRRVLERNGFFLTCQSGSHKIYKNAQGKRVTLPYHGKKILHPKTLKSILNDAGWTIEEFIRL